MFITWALLTSLITLALFSHTGSAGNVKASDKQELTKALQDVVKTILKGATLKDVSSDVDVEAYLIDGKQFQSLLGVLHGEATKCKLIEGVESRIVFESLNIMDNYSAALMVLKTQTPSLGERFHSVVFFHDSSAGWRIKSWHISN